MRGGPTLTDLGGEASETTVRFSEHSYLRGGTEFPALGRRGQREG